MFELFYQLIDLYLTNLGQLLILMFIVSVFVSLIGYIFFRLKHR